MNYDIEQKIESWKNKLLDLSKRNRLLSFRDTKRTTLTITSPDIHSLWKYFVTDEKTIEFDFDSSMDENQNLTHKSTVETNKTSNELYKTLRYLRSKSKIAFQEQGVNVLYVSFGFLEWTESPDSNVSILSPLILVPVTLTVESISSPYILELADEDIVINPTLQHKLHYDFGIKIPQFNDDLSLNEYFRKIKGILVHSDWKIVESAKLSIFSFNKINMYNDIDNNYGSIVENANIKALCGDNSNLPPISENLVNFDFDKEIKPLDVFQILDADSSQQEAILLAKKGVSFVLQGPPGTGKSQTISNIIAENLSQGKKVLFVSEKMAALNVVHNRLTTSGLNDFCLVLHSQKSNKRSILEDLDSVLKLSKNKKTISEAAYLKLDTLYQQRNKLNNYAKEISLKIQPIGKSIYEVYGILAKLTTVPELHFNINNVSETTWSEYTNILSSLSELSNAYAQSDIDVISNPWFNSNIKNITSDLRNQIAVTLPLLRDQLTVITECIQKFQNELGYCFPITYNSIINIFDFLNLAKSPHRVPVEWFDEIQIDSLYDTIQISREFFCTLIGKVALFEESILNLQKFNVSFNSGQCDQITSAQYYNTYNLILNEYLNNEYTLSKIFQYRNVSKLRQDIIEAKQFAEELKNYNHKVLENFDTEIFTIDFRSILARFRSEYTSLLKMTKSEYHHDKKIIKRLYKTSDTKLEDSTIIEVLTLLKLIEDKKVQMSDRLKSFIDVFDIYFDYENTNFSEIEKHLEVYESVLLSMQSLQEITNILTEFSKLEPSLILNFPILYKGIDSDWTSMTKALDWAIQFRTFASRNKLDKQLVKRIITTIDLQNIHSNYERELTNNFNSFSPNFLWYIDLFENSEHLKATEFSSLLDKITLKQSNFQLLEQWIDINNSEENCKNIGLSDYLTIIHKENLTATNIIPVFKKRFFTLWLDYILPKYPSVANFRRLNHESIISEFNSLDKIQLEIAKLRVKHHLIRNLPSDDQYITKLGEVSILRRELAKKRKIMPIRKLFAEIPNLVMTLKPCLMMSPLSVSLFLESNSYQFDTVIFDEASQVCTENAIGAILRGKQIIIAGDSKQLPPTNFFGESLNEEDFDSDDSDTFNDNDAFESLLDEASLFPYRSLEWHYRSRHENLIAFSNAKIYGNRLVTFPSNILEAPDSGVEFVYVSDGVYNTGGKTGNIKEANRVADLVFEHFSKNNGRSLGVIAFGEIQQQAIEMEIRKRRLENQSFEHLFNEEIEYPFFVKNLENVQGDERDTIIFSIGYAKDANGVFRMNFGPLSKTGGERRLNVAITRAKFNLKLVGSILPTDINTDKINSLGPKLLREYIDFAINGSKSLSEEITQNYSVEHDSPFEESVYKYLIDRGIKVDTQVGCSGYRIDMAVKHPTVSGQYIIGIECDGAAYHSSRTARERDRLRQDLLEEMGWKIHRIWSTDWIKNPKVEGERLIQAIEKARNSYISPYDDFESICNEDYTKIDSAMEENLSTFKNESDIFLIEEQNSTFNSKSDFYGFADEGEIDVKSLPQYKRGIVSLQDLITEIVFKRYPIHIDLLYNEVYPFMKSEYTRSEIRSAIDDALKLNRKSFSVKRKFIYPVDSTEIIPRSHNTRKIDKISKDELCEALLYVLDKCIGPTKDELCIETAHAYNFKRLSIDVIDAFNQAFVSLKRNKKIELRDGKVFRTRQHIQSD